MFIVSAKKRIQTIISELDAISENNLERQLSVYPDDAFGKLSRAINRLTHDLMGKISRLEKENNQALAILNSMVEGVIAVNKDARILSINPTVENIFGITKSEAEGVFFLEVIRNHDIFAVIDEVLKSGKFMSRELNIVLPVQKIFQVNASPIFENNVVNGCLAVLHDITEIRRLETIRRDFVANVSHELKTPLTSIKGFVETLIEGALEDKGNAGHFLRIIQDHTDRLNSLISDLLELSYLESRELKLELETIKLRNLVDEVLLGFKSQLKKKAIEVKNDLPLDLSVEVDKEKIEQVFTNLVDNAIKFNKEKGFIRIQSQVSDGKLKITIEDSGIGIPAKDIPRIFERFYRVDKARSRELGGTGLGLSIVKHIIESHGGQAGVESTEGIGSTFWFILPK
ncbi:MAG: ATP-binding protein [Candidatus Omnitrophota bacterium]|nr:ATP-binding protein [Candidatus Omnitrophota bacterium]